MDGCYRKSGTYGFTLVELMTVVSILSILLFMAVPAMQSLIHRSQLRTQVGRLMTSINLVRSEAIARNMPVSMCPSRLAITGEATCSSTYTDGWIVYANRDRDRVVDEGTDTVIRVFEALPRGYTITNKAGTKSAYETITYLPDGSSRRTRTLMICAPGSTRLGGWSVVMSRVGRPRVSNDWGRCPAS